jgi:hypothetical protein
MTRERTRCGGPGLQLEEPYHWSEDEINGYLAMRYRSVADIAFIRGEKPS